MDYLPTLLLLLPAVTALLIGFAPERSAKTLALGGSVVTLIASLLLLLGYNNSGDPFQFAGVNVAWLPGLSNYHTGVDGVAVLLIALTAFLQVFAVWYSQETIKGRVREYFLWLMLFEAALLGAFSSLDVILFYVFFEAALVPAYFLVGIWGGKRRIEAATKFFVYTVAGSLLMLAAIIGMVLYTRGTPNAGNGLDIVALRGALTGTPGLLMFAGFAIAFAVKTGLFPFHTWLPDTYAEAPAPVTALLSGAMAKLGTFGLYRFCLFLFPEAAAQFGPFLVVLGVISIIYGALIAAVQRDAKRVIAYSSVSHLGFVVAGTFALNTIGTSGAVLQMVNHGITAGALFLILGMIEQRRGSTLIRSLGGLWEQMPLLGRLFLIVTLSSIGLPLTNGFAGEFLILLGTFQTQPWLAAIATTGVIWSAVYMLWMFQRVMYGPVDKPVIRRFYDLSRTEVSILAPFVVLIFLLGILPGIALRKADKTVEQAVSAVAPVPVTPAVAAFVSPARSVALEQK